MRTLVSFIATGAYLGYIPLIPGTAGSLLGLAMALLLAPLWFRFPVVLLILFGLSFAGACWIAGAAEQIFEQHDSSRIVIDEVFGMVAALGFNPTGLVPVAIAFALFRLFDIVKPWPASYFDRMSGGAGVMLDDLVAGVYANLLLQIIRRLI